MKSLIALFLCGFTFLAQADEDYILTIDGKPSGLSLGTEKTLELKDGQKVTVLLKRKEIVSFEGRLFSFTHKSSLTPQRADLGDGVHQTLMASPVGTVVIVQEYANLDPASVVDVMVKELTKEEVKAGYKLQEEKAERKLTDGKVLKGKKSVSTSKDEQWTRHILAHGDDKGGVLVITMISKDNVKAEMPLIDTFWSSFQVKTGSKR